MRGVGVLRRCGLALRLPFYWLNPAHRRGGLRSGEALEIGMPMGSFGIGKAAGVGLFERISDGPDRGI